MVDTKNCWLKDRCKKASCCPEKFCIKLFKINELCNYALLTPSQRRHYKLRIDTDGTDREIYTYLKQVEHNIEDFVDKGENLYLYSPITGNGKTAWSIRLLNSYIEKIWYKSDLICRALFVNVPRFLIALKDSISNNNEYYNQIKDNILTADIVVFDEIGTKSATTFEAEHLLSIVNSRIDNKKSCIYTSNLNPKELEGSVGSRMYSRIINCSTVLYFQGADKRGVN